MTFFRESKVAARKRHRCDACQTYIEQGEHHSYMAGTADGDFWTARNHSDCRAAECGLANLHGHYGTDWIFLHDMDDEDRAWVQSEYPTAFDRLRRAAATEKGGGA